MEVNLSTRETRTLVPVTVTLSDVTEPVSVTIREGSYDLFRVDLKKKHDDENGRFFWQGEFWLENPGSYEVWGIDSLHRAHASLQVREQIFLPFEVEFGIFLSVLSLASLGIILWYKKRTKKYH